MRYFLFTVCAVFSLTSLSAQATTDILSRKDVENIIQEYLTENPDLVLSAIEKGMEKKQAEAQEKAKEAVGENRDELIGDPHSPRAGNTKNPDITVVEFFDYHCGYCKHLLPDITRLMKEDKGVQVVFREFPILSEDSELASKAALAVYALKPERYFAFHTALMGNKGRFSQQTLEAEAEKVGISASALKAAMEKPEIQQNLDNTRRLAQTLGLRGTPAMIIGDEVIPQAMPLEEIKKVIAAERNKKTTK